mmetsp:Transcript_32148/g.51766  ORF Transcript_32148/g.51766 Transcript_32148/m.51766 type:complete len:205 (-) Transcript_32148:288-902(-)
MELKGINLEARFSTKTSATRLEYTKNSLRATFKRLALLIACRKISALTYPGRLSTLTITLGVAPRWIPIFYSIRVGSRQTMAPSTRGTDCPILLRSDSAPLVLSLLTITCTTISSSLTTELMGDVLIMTMDHHTISCIITSVFTGVLRIISTVTQRSHIPLYMCTLMCLQRHVLDIVPLLCLRIVIMKHIKETSVFYRTLEPHI